MKVFYFHYYYYYFIIFRLYFQSHCWFLSQHSGLIHFLTAEVNSVNLEIKYSLGQSNEPMFHSVQQLGGKSSFTISKFQMSN